jgi:hypothetical protein
MNQKVLLKYFSHIVHSKQGPQSVMRFVIREFYLDTLSATSNRSELTQLSEDEFHEKWLKLTNRPAFNPQPDPYVIVPCYRFLLNSIDKYVAVKVTATLNNSQAFDYNNQVVYQEESVDYRDALYFIGIADEVLRPYISEFCWSKDKTVISLNFT